MMNTLHKPLTIAILAVSIVISGLNVDFASAQNTVSGPAPARPTVDLTPSSYLKFWRITTDDGLSNNQVFGIVQDHYEFMWFGTSSGLNRYDGAGTKVYRNDPTQPNSLSHDRIRHLTVDKRGILWIATMGGGLNRYNREKDNFTRYQYDPDDPHSLSDDNLITVYEDGAGTIWVGASSGGLNKLDRDSGQFTRYVHNPDDPNSLSSNNVRSIVEDREGFLWLGTGNGLNRFDPQTGLFLHYRRKADDPTSLSHNFIRSVYLDRSGTLWVCTRGGLCKYHPETDRFTRYQHDPEDHQSLSGNNVSWIYEDRANRLWVGTLGSGLNQFDREKESFSRLKFDASDRYSLSGNAVYQIYEGQHRKLWITTDGGVSMLDGEMKPFRHYRAIPSMSNSLSGNVVREIHAAPSRFVWVGTTGGGLNRFDRQKENFTQYQHDPADPNSISSSSVSAAYEDRMGIVWVGTYRGLNKLDPETGRVTRYRHDSGNPHSPSHPIISFIYEDRQGVLWIGTWGVGLSAFDRQTEQFDQYQPNPTDPKALSHNLVTYIYEDRAGELWIGTQGGLNKFNRETKTFSHYKYDPSDSRSLSNNLVASIYEDQKGTLWIGTSRGLNRFDRENDAFTHYTIADGLPDPNIWGILEDEQGRLWLSTANGLSSFDPQTERFRNYDVSDGLQSNTFYYYAAHSKSRSGEMFFGGSNGFTAFYPDQILDNPYVPPVLISDFQLANKPVAIGADSVLKKSILETDEIVLSHQDRVVSFEIAVLNYQAPEKNKIRYIMEGFEKEWNEVDLTRRFVTYTNLDPGEYVFKAIGSNNDGVLNEEGDSIRITVTPPWWGTMWLRISMVVVAIGLLAGGFRWRVGAIEARSRKLEIQVQRRTQEMEKTNKELEIANKVAVEARDAAETANRAKSLFLANMSHELRTPLHAILGFSRLLTRDSDQTAEQQERLDIINRSGEHLLGMVDDILSLSKIEAGRIELKQESFGVIQMLQDLDQMMKSRAEGKGLRFALELDPALPAYVQGDAGRVRQVLINLLGNAVKFTETGDVWLRAHSQPMADDPDMVMLQLEVQDSGPGIPRNKLDEVFETFARFDHAQNIEKGAGLGLAISKTLVNMMNGEITIESEPGQGSLFKVNIPFQAAAAGTAIHSEAPVAEVIGLQADQPEWRILVVDDNLENRVLLSNMLSRIGCIVREAQNGSEAISIFKEWQPHLIWMDMRMPVQDGYAATRKIRTLPGGEAVSIVAVTASVLAEQQEPILAAGCDELVRKPFRDHEIFEAMARQLNIKYLYQDRGTEAAQKQEIILTAEMLAELPPELLQGLGETTLELNVEASMEVIERIAEHAPDTAETLRALVNNFKIAKIRKLLGEVG